MFKYFIIIIVFIFSNCGDSSSEESNLCKGVNCENWEYCEEGECLLNDGNCNSKTDCEDDQICENNICVLDQNFDEGLTVATFNVHDFSYSNSYQLIADWIYSSGIDIVIFEEIQKEDTQYLQDQLSILDLNYEYAFTSYGGYAGDEYDFIAVWSRYPIKQYTTIITGTYQDPITGNYHSMRSLRPVLRVELEYKDNTINFYGVHLKAHTPYPNCDTCLERRRAQAHALEEYILEHHNPENDYIVIAGDVNSAVVEDYQEGNSVDILSLKSDNPDNENNDFIPVNYTELPDTTWTHNSYDNILDHIFLSPKLFEKYRDGSVDVPILSPQPSDHRPVVLTIDF